MTAVEMTFIGQLAQESRHRRVAPAADRASGDPAELAAIRQARPAHHL